MLCDLATSAHTFTVQTLTGQLASIHDRLLIWNIWSYFYCNEWSLNDTPLKYQRGILYGTKFWIGNWFLLAVMFEWLPKCWCKKSMSRVWVEELSDTGYLLSAITQPFVILRAAQLYWSRLSDTLWYGLWTLIETLEPGFSASKTAGTRAGGAPDSWVTMVIMNTRAGEERRQEVCDRR